jgi:Ca2+-binding EF-hand superfamily protein
MGNIFRSSIIENTNKLRTLPFEKPTQKDYDFLSHFSDLDQTEIKDEIDKFLAEHTDGRMNGLDFCSLYNTLRKDLKSVDRISENLFRNIWFRSSGHDLISFREFELMFALTSNKGTLADKLNFAFYLYDVDENNVLEIDEVKEIIQNILELFRDPKHPKNIDCLSNEIYKNLKVDQIITKGLF